MFSALMIIVSNSWGRKATLKGKLSVDFKKAVVKSAWKRIINCMQQGNWDMEMNQRMVNFCIKILNLPMNVLMVNGLIPWPKL